MDDWLLTMFASRVDEVNDGWVGVLVWLCAWVHVFPLVLTKFSVKSFSTQRAIGTAQSVGQQGGFLVVEEDRMKT